VVANREMIVAASDEARALAIKPGMTLAEGRAMCAYLRHAPHDPVRDAKSLEALARWMTRFSPVVQIGVGSASADGTPSRRGTFPSAKADPTGVGVYLDLTGCERVFGGIDQLVGLIISSLDRLKLGVRVAVGPTVGAAWALTFGGRDVHGKMFEEADLPAALPPLPVEALRVDEEIAEVLRHLGVETIGQLARLPRKALPSRFGELLVRRVDQAFGRATEPMTPIAFHKPVEASVEFDGVVSALEAMWEALRQLLGRVVEELRRRGCGAKQVDVTFLRPEAEAIRKTIHLSAATCDGMTLFNLLRCAMETMAGTGSRGWGIGSRVSRIAFHPRPQTLDPRPSPRLARYLPEGFIGVHLRIPTFERLTEEQISLLDQDAIAADRELARLIERLRIKLGEEVIGRTEHVESHLPESAFSLSPCPRVSLSGLPHHRPLHLLPTPVEVRVMVSPSHDRDGRPIWFAREGQVYPVRHAVGPERICGPWWLGRHKTRDYFDAAVERSGERFWLFRVPETGKWYLHGEFE
jgi:protein ImuB